MEFQDLTRRIAEKTGIDASSVEADAKLSSSPPPPAGEVAAHRPQGEGVAGGGTGDLFAPPPPTLPRKRGRESGAANGALTPLALATARSEAARTAKIDRSKYETVGTLARLKEWIARAHEAGIVAVDTETTSLDPMTAHLCGFSLAVAPNEACYVPIGHRDGGGEGKGDLFSPEAKLCAGQIPERDALAAIKALLEDKAVLKIGQNLKYDWLVFAQRGIEMRGYDDTMLISYVLDAGKGGHGMDDLAKRWLNHDTIHFQHVAGSGKNQVTFDCVTIEKATEYAAEDADVTLRLWYALKARLAAEHVTTVYETLERPMPTVLARMERRGISIDRQVLSRLSGEFAQEQARLEDEIKVLAGEPLNPGSPKQIGDILFGKLGLPGGTKTKTGQWSTGARELEDLAEQHELPRKILDWRQVSKLRSTYTEALPTYVNPTTHRVHTSYALASTSTGRLSSSEPNLQNIPVRTEDGRKIRRAFVAAPGMKLVSADYSQIELRLLSEVADVPALRKAFQDKVDIHAMTASEMFGVPVKDMPARRAPPRQGHQFRHHLRHFRLRPRRAARHRQERGRRLHQKIFRALPRHPRLHGRDARVLPRARLCAHAVRPQVPLPGHPQLKSIDPLLQRARRHQCAPARERGRHHPPRHDPHRAGAREGQAARADAAAGARRADLRGAGERSEKHHHHRQKRDGGCPASGDFAARAAAGRRPRRRQLGRGALALSPHGEERGRCPRVSKP